jgi:hypothetical protein
MSVTLVSPAAAETETGEQRFVIGVIRWDAYLAISEALDEHRGARMIFNDGRLILLVENYDFDVDPPPDLAIEVEATRSADDAIAAWGWLCVPEVWRFDAATSICTFWNRSEGGTYQQVDRSMFLPMLGPSDVVDQLNRAKELGSSKWYVKLEELVRDVIRSGLAGDAS